MEIPLPPPVSSSTVPHHLGWVQRVGGFHRLHHLVPVLLHNASIVAAVVVILIKAYRVDGVLLDELSPSYFTLFWCFTLEAFVTHVLFASVLYAWAWKYPEPQEVSKRRCTYGCSIDLLFGDLPMFTLQTKMVYEIQFKSPSLGVAYCICCLTFFYTGLRVWIFFVQLLAKLNFLYDVKRSHPPYRPEDIRDAASLSFAYRFYNMPKEHFPAPQLTNGIFEEQESEEESENDVLPHSVVTSPNKREEDGSESDGQRSRRDSSSLGSSQLTQPFEKKKDKKRTSQPKKEEKRIKDEKNERKRRSTVVMNVNRREGDDHSSRSSFPSDKDRKEEEEDSDQFPSFYARCPTMEEIRRDARHDVRPPSLSSSIRDSSPLENTHGPNGASGGGRSYSYFEKKSRKSDAVGDESVPGVGTRMKKREEWEGRRGESEEGGPSLPSTQIPWRPHSYRSESVDAQWRNDRTMPVKERGITRRFKYGSYRRKDPVTNTWNA